jgi:hypothetical protein
MQCPRCHALISFAQMAKHRCPSCSVKVYFSPKWRWLRDIACSIVALLSTCRWYPLERSLELHVVWCATLFLVFLALLLTSVYLLPPEVDLVPETGPVRLDL